MSTETRVEGWAERPDSIFDLLTDTEIEGIDELAAGVDAAEQEVQRLARAHADAEYRLSLLAARTRRNPATAAARFLGETPAFADPPPPPESESPGELRDVIEGLKIRQRDAEAEVERAAKARDNEVSRLVRVAAERSAQVYVKAAKELQRHWAILGSAQSFAMDEAGFGPDAPPARHIFPQMSAAKLFIPGCTQLEPLRKAAAYEKYGEAVLFAGEEDRGVTKNAYERFRQALAAHKALPSPRRTRRAL